jgi:hypothetical protein
VQRHDPETRYRNAVRKQQIALEEYAAHEREWSFDFIEWCKLRKYDIPDGEYKAAVFFINKEYLNKPGSLTELYLIYQRLITELPVCTKENAFELLEYRFKVYAEVLKLKGF